MGKNQKINSRSNFRGAPPPPPQKKKKIRHWVKINDRVFNIVPKDASFQVQVAYSIQTHGALTKINDGEHHELLLWEDWERID